MRKSQVGGGGASVAGVLLHLLPAVLFFALFAAVGILHVAGRVLVVDAGYRISQAEAEHRALVRDNDRLKLERATLRAPARLERLAREQLQMAMPTAAAVVDVASGGATRLGRKLAPPAPRGTAVADRSEAR